MVSHLKIRQDRSIGGDPKEEADLPPLHLAERCLLCPLPSNPTSGQQVDVLGWVCEWGRGHRKLQAPLTLCLAEIPTAPVNYSLVTLLLQ